LPQASSLAAKIKKEFGIDVELIKGGGGVFDVKADGKLIYSKHETGRFPDNQEVIDALAALQK
jgi:selenoprotein W-related protein